MKTQTIWALIVSSALLAACATVGDVPNSWVYGQPELMLPVHHYPIKINSIDKKIQFESAVRVPPGLHEFVFTAAPGMSARTVQKKMVMAIEPCTRYYLLARRNAAIESDWELVIHSKEAVGGCDRQKEINNALR